MPGFTGSSAERPSREGGGGVRPAAGPGPLRKLPGRIDEATAAGIFARRRGLGFLGARRLALELVHLPLYLIDAVLEDPAASGPSSLTLAVCGLLGDVRRLDREAAAERPLAAAAGEVFPPRLAPEEALARAREELPWLVLPVALKHRRAFPLRSLRLRALLGYPWWVEHLRRGRHRDIRALDATAGTLAGARVRAAILEAFLGAARERRPPPAGG